MDKKYPNDEIMTFNTVRIAYMNEENKEVGGGTSFFFHYTLADNFALEFLVTNKHVFKGCRHGRLFFHQKVGDGSALSIAPPFIYDINDWQPLWFGHPNNDIDIAVMSCVDLYQRRFGTRPDINIQFTDVIPFINYSFIPSSLCYTQDTPVNAIEELYFVGYPSLLWDEHHAMPIIRRGINATRIDLDFQNRPEFLIDASVFPGSSGSPVFILNEGVYRNRTTAILGASRCVFLGVLSQSVHRPQLGNLVIEHASLGQEIKPLVNERIDIGHVLKARVVLETIEAWLKNKGIDPDELKHQAKKMAKGNGHER